MTSRIITGWALSAIALGMIGSASAVKAQDAPFTIRRPKDGVTIREKQRVEIPRGSIHPGGFVAIYLDDNFYTALATDEEEGNADKPFTFVWDTKGSGVSDGEHTLRAVLYEPSANAGGNTAAVNEVARSSVKLTVANIIHDGPSSLLLRYRYNEGDDLDYSRNGKAFVVGGDSLSGKIGDEELGAVKSTLLLSVQDSRYDNESQTNVFLVRNKLTSLIILDGAQEREFDHRQLSNSMYQELLPDGSVRYETGDLLNLEFTSLGLPVNNTLELPKLPTLEVEIGKSWNTPGQRLDIPGMPALLQPRVTLVNKLVDLEWEGNYKTAKIHQSFSGPINSKVVNFGPIEVTSPTVTFSRDIFIAYDAKRLIRMNRTLTVKGRTTSPIGAPVAFSGSGPVGNGGAQGFGGGAGKGGFSAEGGGVGGFPGSGGLGVGPKGGGIGGSGGFPGGGGSRGSGGGAGSGGFPGGGIGGFPGSGGAAGGGSGGFPGGGAPRGSGAGPGSGGGAGTFGSFPGAGAGSGASDTPHAITLRSVTETQLLPSSSFSKVSSARTVSMKRKPAKRH